LFKAIKVQIERQTHVNPLYIWAIQIMNMRKLLLLLCGLVFFCGAVFASRGGKLPLVPEPTSVVYLKTTFALSDSVVIVAPDSCQEAKYFSNYVSQNYRIILHIQTKAPRGVRAIIFSVKSSDTAIQYEGYLLNIAADEIRINASTSAGSFYAVQTLIQLMPLERQQKVLIPSVSIADAPQYKWRGMHLDCSRHFFTKAEIEKYLDLMAMYKLNIFHWHLTDDQGWRIEIKRYPLLTQISSMRKETETGHRKDTGFTFDGKPYGGFYTQEDIKEIVAYAAQRHITIVPEIEMPGHSVAALAAYPQYSCTGGPFETRTTWGVSEDVYCAGNDSTFAFLENILTEVCALFPGQYIHIGGDECPKERWKTCPKCQARIKSEHLANEEELQSYFIKRIVAFLQTKGKTVIGWDEILEGGLAPGAMVMSWRGTDGGIAAAEQHHFVVMTPGNPCYFDHYQSKNRAKEPLAIGGYNPLEAVYKYNPAPAKLKAKDRYYILGAQGNVWTEYMPDFAEVEYMAVPRMCALAEALWSDPGNKSYKQFIGGLVSNRNGLTAGM
jgi:hexosaminidase